MTETVHGMLGAAAKAWPHQVVRFPSEGETVSYRALAGSARALAGQLISGDLAVADPAGGGLPPGGLPSGALAGGVRRGEPVGVLSPNAPEFLQALFAVTAAGGAACPLPLPFSLADVSAYGDRLARIADVAGMRLVLASPRLARLTDHLGAILPRLTFAAARPCDADPSVPLPAPLPPVSPDDAAIVQFTSGSTALPKGVRLTHRNVLAGLAAISEGIALRTADNAADGGGFWLPLFHDMGLFGVMAGIAAGVPLHIWSPASFIKQPARWLREFSASGATITAMPDFGYRTLISAISPEEAAELDLTRWRIAFNGAEPVQWETVQEFTSRFAPAGFRAETMFSVYGMAEATLAITFPPIGRGPVFDWVDRDQLAEGGRAVPAPPGTPRARVIAGVGRPVTGIDLRIAAPDSGATLPDGMVGEILIRGASVTAGYLGEAPRAASRWLRTGDLAYTRDGEVFITGRLKEMITVRGANYYPQDVEVIARAVPGVFRGHCAAVAGQGPDGTEEVVLVAETTLTAAAAGELAADLRRRLAAELGLTAVTIRLVKPRAIPRTSSGKVRRLASRDVPVAAESRPAVTHEPED